MIDLKDWDPDSQLLMEGEWHFFWNELLTPQEALNRISSPSYQAQFAQSSASFQESSPARLHSDLGYATYALKIRNLPKTPLAVSSLQVYSSSVLYFYAESAASLARPVSIQGRVGRNFAETLPSMNMKQFVPVVTNPGEDHFIVVQAANFHHSWGGMWVPPRIGSFSAILNQFDTNRTQAFLVLGMLALIFLYNFSFYLRRREDKASLYLSLFVGISIIRSLSLSYYGLDVFHNPGWSHEVQSKSIFLTMIIPTLVFQNFLKSCFPEQTSARLLKISWGIASLPIAYILVNPVVVYGGIGTFLKSGTVILSLYLLTIIARAVRAGASGALLSLVGAVCLVIGSLIDIATSYGLKNMPMNCTGIGLAAFAACQSQIIAARFAIAFRKSEHLSRSLTLEVDRQTRDIKTILKNIRQGIFTLLPPFHKVDDQYSEFLVPMLGTTDIAGRTINELLLKYSDLSSDSKSQIVSTLDASMGEDAMNFDMNEQNLAREIIYQSAPDEAKKILEIDWNPIVNKQHLVEKILVSLRDVTEVRKLQQDATNRENDMRIILELIQIPEDRFLRFTSKANEYLKENRELILGDPSHRSEVIKRLFMNMHTIKGAARTFFLMAISAAAHDVEQYYAALQRNEEDWDVGLLSASLETVESIILHYQMVGEERLGWNARERLVKVDRSSIEQQLTILQDIDKYGLPAHLLSELRRVENYMGGICYDSIEHIIDEASRGLDSIARDLGENIAKIHFPRESILLKEKGSTFLYNVLLHMFRNSMDHGIELPEMRQSRGKPSQGSIFIELEHKAPHRVI